MLWRFCGGIPITRYAPRHLSNIQVDGLSRLDMATHSSFFCKLFRKFPKCFLIPQHPSNKIKVALARLEADEQALLKLAQRMVEAHDGAIYKFDFFANAAINRSLALSRGFRTLIHGRNLICAGALLRLQLDTAIRFFAGSHADSLDGFADAVLDGEHIRNIKDRNGHAMTDRYLVTQLSQEHPWVEPIYEKTSSYVRMSATHIFSTFAGHNREDPSIVHFKIGSHDKDLPDKIYLEAITVFREATKILAHYVEGWIFTKNNPEETST